GTVPEAGILSGDSVTGLGRGMISVITLGRPLVSSGPSYPLSSVKLMAPIPKPPKLICVGLNYRDHAREAGLEIPKVPAIFSKFSNVVIGPGDPIVLPKISTKP